MGWWNEVFSKAETKTNLKALQGETKALQDAYDNLLNQIVFQSLTPGGITYLPVNAQSYVNSGYMDNPTIYSIVTKILDKLKIAPLELYEVIPDAKAQYKNYKTAKYSPRDIDQYMKAAYKKKGLKEIESGQLSDLLKQPNPDFTQAEFIEALGGFWNVCGEMFIYGTGPEDGPNAGKITEMYVMPSHLVEIVQGDWQNPVLGYKLRIGNQQINIPKRNVLHMKRWNPSWDLSGSQLRGQSPLRAGMKTLSINNMAIESQGNALVNGGMAGIVSPRNIADTWEKPQTDEIKEKIKREMVGPKNAAKLLAFGQSIDFTKVGIDPIDLQILEKLKDDKVTLSALWNVDRILIDGSGATFENQEKALKALVTNVCLPWYNNFEQKLNNWIMPGYSCTDKKQYCADFDTTVFPELRPDYVQLNTVFGNMWSITPNQRNEIFGIERNPDPNMDKIYIPNTFVKLDDIADTDPANTPDQGDDNGDGEY